MSEAFDQQLYEYQEEMSKRQSQKSYTYYRCSLCGKLYRYDEKVMECIDDDKEALEIYQADMFGKTYPFKCGCEKEN